MTDVREDRENRVDVWEHRSAEPFGVEYRADSDTITLTGYASTFQPYEMYGGPATGGWIEQLDRRAFDKTLREKPDLHLLINHEGMPLARTKSGTLQLSTDGHGLKVVAQLDRSDPDVQRLEPKMRRGDMDEMSFAFRVRAQKWEAAKGFEADPQSLRTITDVNLQKGDVSVVNWGANDTTHAEIKSVDDAICLLAQCDPTQLVEARSSRDMLRLAKDRIAELEDRGRGPDLTKPASEDRPPQGGQSILSAPDGQRMDATPAGEPDDSTRAPKTLSLRDALARQGLAADDGSTLSLKDALAQAGEPVEDAEDPEVPA